MNDILFEQVIPQKRTLKNSLPHILLLFGLLVITLLSFFFSGVFFIIILLLCLAIGRFMIIPNFKTEIEYSIYNEEFEISMVYNQEKRKTKALLNLQKAKCIAPSGADQLDIFQPSKVVDFSSGRKDAKTYEIMISNGSILCCYIIEPNDEMAKCMKRSAGSNMVLNPHA